MTKQRILTWSKAAAAVTVVIAVCAGASGLFRLGVDRQSVEAALTEHDHQLADHEERIRSTEQLTAETRTDVKWIRKFLERSEGGP